MFQSLLKSKHQSEIPPCRFYPFIKTEHARENILSSLFQNLLWFRLRNHEEYTQKRRGEIGKGHFAPIQHANEKHSLQKFVYFKKSTNKLKSYQNFHQNLLHRTLIGSLFTTQRLTSPKPQYTCRNWKLHRPGQLPAGECNQHRDGWTTKIIQYERVPTKTQIQYPDFLHSCFHKWKHS